MKQQINLFLPSFRKERPLFSASAMFVSAALMFGGLMSIYGYGLWSEWGLEQELTRLQAARKAAMARLESVSSQHKAEPKSQLLETELNRMTAEKKQKSELLHLLSRGGFSSNAGFSRHFEGLARQRISGLWLTHIAVYSAGEQISLQGVTLEESLIPRYLQKLAQEPAFSGTEFKQIKLERPADEPGVTFELHTSTTEEPNPAMDTPP